MGDIIQQARGNEASIAEDARPMQTAAAAEAWAARRAAGAVSVAATERDSCHQSKDDAGIEDLMMAGRSVGWTIGRTDGRSVAHAG